MHRIASLYQACAALNRWPQRRRLWFGVATDFRRRGRPPRRSKL